MSAALSQSILWEPTPPQAEFLAATEDEVLFGGGAGGGKSDALVIDSLGLALGSIDKPHYRGLLIRRTIPEAREIIDRSRALYPQIVSGATFKEQAKAWEFPSGAKILFGYCERDVDVYQYQGSQFQYIGIDELGHFATSFVWEYLTSRLRSPDKTLPCYMRATCNPGPKWIMERFGIDRTGTPNTVSVKVDDITIRRRFIPSRLSDNPHLSGTGYEQRLKLLPEAERRALLYGEWGVVDVPGAYYGAEMTKARDEGRLTTVPVDPRMKVWTVWDLGVRDSTAIWFVQVHGAQVRVVDYYEASGEGLAHYANVLTAKGYSYGGHFAPHDIEVRELGSGMSRLEIAASLGIAFRIAPQLPVADGINAVRMLLGRCWFDATKCGPGVSALDSYRKDYNSRLGEFKATPVHDWASHGADAFRYLAVSVDQMSNTGTPTGDPYKAFRGSWHG